MYDSSLFDNLKLINKDDWKEFRLFVDSDFNNRGSYKEETRWLCDYISSVYPDFEHKKLKKEKVLSALFKDKAVISGKLEKIMHELNTMCRNYLIWKSQNSEENSFYRDLEWLKILRESLDEDRYLLFMEKARKKFDAIEKVSPEYYYQKYLLEKEWHEWLSTVNRVRDDLNLVETIQTFNEYSSIQLLSFVNHALIQKKLTKFELPENIPDQTLRIHMDMVNSSNLIVKLFLKINEVLNKEIQSENDLSEFTLMINEFSKNIEKNTLKDLFAYLRNMCVLICERPQINTKNVEILLHKIQKDNLVNGFFYANEKITPNALMGIIKMALMTKNIQFAIETTENHKEKIIGQSLNLEFYYINKAACLFELNQFNEALSILPYSTKNLFYNTILKTIEIKCYFELDSDLFLYKIDAFKIYIIRLSQKFISQNLKMQYLEFIKILSNIYRIDQNKEKIGQKALDTMSKNKPTDKLWLTTKIHNIMNYNVLTDVNGNKG